MFHNINVGPFVFDLYIGGQVFENNMYKVYIE